MTHYILVHGAFENGDCWEFVADGLRRAGHSVEAPNLPGAPGEGTSHERVTLQSAARAVIDLVDAVEETVVLVGHSNGGMVIAQVAADRADRVEHLIYLTAFRPLDGECLLDLTSLPEGARDGVQANLRIEGASAFFDPAAIKEVFAHDCAPEIVDRIRSRIGPQPLSMFDTTVRITSVELPPASYILCTDDRAIPETLQRLMAEREPAAVYELASSHAPYYSHPDDVIRLVIQASGESQGNAA